MSDTLALDGPAELARAAAQPTDEFTAVPLWHVATVSTLDEVERLLCRAERAGHREHELTVLGPSVFVVRWH